MDAIWAAYGRLVASVRRLTDVTLAIVFRFWVWRLDARTRKMVK